MVSSLKKSSGEILTYIRELEKRVFSNSELNKILNSNRDEWSLVKSVNLAGFVRMLLENKVLEKIKLSFPRKKIIRYIKPQTLPYELGLSLDENAYLSHLTAIFLHGLTNTESENIFVNSEQSPKRSKGSVLLQESIDRAFKNPARITTNKALFSEQSLKREILEIWAVERATGFEPANVSLEG